MEQQIKDDRIKQLNSNEKWDKAENGFWFILQTLMLSFALEIAFSLFVRSLGLKIEITWCFLLSCFMLIYVFQITYMMTKQHLENIKKIEEKYKYLQNNLK